MTIKHLAPILCTLWALTSCTLLPVFVGESYAELWVTETPWPDFDTAQLKQAIAAYSARERKFGTVSPAQLLQGEEEA